MKKIKKILLVLVLLVVVLGIVAVLFLDQIVKTGIVTVAPKITQTTFTLGSVHISMLTGSVSLNNLVVGNPAGFKTAQAISLGKAAVSVKPMSLLADKIVVQSVEIRSPEVTFEGNPFGDNNLTKIMDNVNASAGTAAAPVTNAPAAAKPAKKIEVDDLTITGIKVHASITGMEGKEFNVSIPDIHFTDLGKDGNGITPAELTQKILSQITTGTIKAVGDYAKNIMGSTANDLIKGASTTTGKAVGAGADSVKKTIGGLFGK